MDIPLDLCVVILLLGRLLMFVGPSWLCSLLACCCRVDRAAILEPVARLPASFYRDVVPRTADQTDKARMAAGLSLLPRVDTVIPHRALDLARRTA